MIVWQEPPPFIQFMEEAERLGRMSFMAGVCVGGGVVTGSQEGVVAIVEDFERRAILAGTDGPVVMAALQSGMGREEANVATMMDFGPENGPNYQRRYDQGVEYVGGACADLVADNPDTFSLSSEDK